MDEKNNGVDPTLTGSCNCAARTLRGICANKIWSNKNPPRLPARMITTVLSFRAKSVNKRQIASIRASCYPDPITGLQKKEGIKRAADF